MVISKKPVNFIVATFEHLFLQLLWQTQQLIRLM